MALEEAHVFRVVDTDSEQEHPPGFEVTQCIDGTDSVLVQVHGCADEDQATADGPVSKVVLVLSWEDLITLRDTLSMAIQEFDPNRSKDPPVPLNPAGTVHTEEDQ